MDKELVDYIKAKSATGASNNAIQSELLSKGWDIKKIEAAFFRISNGDPSVLKSYEEESAGTKRNNIFAVVSFCIFFLSIIFTFFLFKYDFIFYTTGLLLFIGVVLGGVGIKSDRKILSSFGLFLNSILLIAIISFVIFIVFHAEDISKFEESNTTDQVSQTEDISWALATELNELGLQAANNKDLNLAESLYRQAIEKDSTFYYAYNNLGNLLASLGKNQEAFDTYQKALEIKPDYAKVYNNLGALSVRNGDKQKAKELYEKSISIDQTDPNPYGNLALILDLDDGNTTEAIPYYKKSVELGTENTRVLERYEELLAL